MRKNNILKFLWLFLVVIGCTNEEDINPTAKYNFTFTNGNENWQSFFSDYPVGGEVFYELEFKNEFLPSPLDQRIKSLKISGNNHSDDLFSAIFRKFENLHPNKLYSITFNIDIASNALIGGSGIGGDPNLSLGAGGINYLPNNTTDNLNHYRPNFISKIQSGQSNEVFKIIGKIGSSNIYPTPYKIINRNNIGNPFAITTNSNGEFWLMIATDSGFEGITTLYYKSINIIIE
jgi:hypothetical protein